MADGISQQERSISQPQRCQVKSCSDAVAAVLHCFRPFITVGTTGLEPHCCCHPAHAVQPRTLPLVPQLVRCPGLLGCMATVLVRCAAVAPLDPTSSSAPPRLHGRVGWTLLWDRETADLRCCELQCEGVLVEGPSSNASQRHTESAISGFSKVNPMDMVTTPTPWCLRQSPRSHCSCSAS